MSYVKGKVALITGGSRGIGYEFAKALMKNCVKGIMLADISEEEGKEAVCKLEECGDGEVQFLKTDVSVPQQLKNAFDATVQSFDQVDILISNAGVIQEGTWEKMIKINYIAVVRGLLMGMKDYLPRCRSSDESIIINTASVVGLQPLQCFPLYSTTKHGVIGLTRVFGTEYYYKKHQTRIMAICPGLTHTYMIEVKNLPGVDVKLMEKECEKWVRQNADQCGVCLIKAIEEGKNGSCWVTEGNENYAYPFADRFDVRKNMKKSGGGCK